MSSTSERDYYTVAEVAERLNVHHSTVWRWIKAGRLPSYRVGSRNIRIKQGDVDRMLTATPYRRRYEGLSLEEARKLIGRKPSAQELARRRRLFERVQRNRQHRNIAPMTSDELVRLGRDRDFWYGPDD